MKGWKKAITGAVCAVALLPLAARAQETVPPFPVTLEKQLAAKATNYSEVTLDRKMLAFASKFMDKEDGGDKEGQQIVSKLDGIYVRSYEFDKSGVYTAADLDTIRSHFQGSDWTQLVKERSKNAEDDSDIYMKVVNGEVHGMFILNAEPKELNFVFISGPIRPEDFKELGGNFGIPKGIAPRTGKQAQKEQGK